MATEHRAVLKLSPILRRDDYFVSCMSALLTLYTAKQRVIIQTLYSPDDCVLLAIHLHHHHYSIIRELEQKRFTAEMSGLSLTPSNSQEQLIKDGWFSETEAMWPGTRDCTCVYCMFRFTTHLLVYNRPEILH
jgi:hypothetical protein